MLKKILGTFGSRLLCTFITLGIVILNSRSFGSSGVGTISIFILGITILQNLTSFVGGSSLVYLLPRKDPFQLVFLSYFFSIIINILGSILLLVFHLIDKQYFWQLLFASSFFSFYYIHSLILLSQENIKTYNIFAVSQIILQLGIMLLFLYIIKIKDVTAYIYGYLFSYIIVAVFSIPCVWGKIMISGFKNIMALFKQMIVYGFVIQIANLAQLFNYRLSYYIIQLCSGGKPLGLFDLGTKLSEAVWILPKSLATVEYTRISNCKEDKQYAKKVTLAFLKLAFIFALIATIILLCIPAQWIAWIFSSEFFESKPVIFALAFGIIIFSCNIILSHYFSGFGLYKINAIASLIGVFITIGLGISLIPWFSNKSYMDVILGVGGITSLSYISSFIYTFIHFIKHSHLKFKELWIDKKDINLLQTEMKKILRNHDKNKTI